jgi:hypothetical protein
MFCGTTCKALGAACQQNSECCSTHCVLADGGGTCQACVPLRQPCAVNTDCCSNLCLAGTCNTP